MSEDLDPSVLHHTPGVDEFLDPRSNKFFVLGTKGLGKTLLLKARRIGADPGVLCLPRNALIDKPIGDTIFSTEMVALYGRSTENWKKLWRIALITATLKAVGQTTDVDLDRRLAGVVSDRHLTGVMDHFVHLLDFSRSELLRAAADTDKHLVPRIRNLDAPVAIFIDSIDEYFNKHILALSASDAGELQPDVWYLAQMGLVEAAYELRRLTHHLKVYAAIRKEAFDRFGAATSMVQQYRGSTIEIRYSNEALREILIRNVERERRRNLVDPSRLKQDPLAAFLGLTHVLHTHTGEHEEIGDYIVRHTLGRPRDLMTIGGALARIPPTHRDENGVKMAVNEAATEIAEEYLNEIAPFTDGLDLEAAFMLLPRNVMTAEEAESLGRRYTRRVNGEGGERRDLLATLYRAGLIGVVIEDHIVGGRIQSFLRPGQATGDDGVRPPRSPHYLVHPILSQIISRVNPGYMGAVDRTNIVGDGRSWVDAPSEARFCVLRADVRGFSEIMDGDHHVAIRSALVEIVAAHAAECPIADVVDGDSLTIVHEDPRTIIKVARRIMEDLHDAPGHPRLRVAIDHGPIQLAAGDAKVTVGAPFRVAARLEPKVDPGQIWVTAAFEQALAESPGFYEAVPVPDADQINIKKSGSAEPDELIDVYRIVDRN